MQLSAFLELEKGRQKATMRWRENAVLLPIPALDQLDLITILSTGANRVFCWREQMTVRDEKTEITVRGPRHPLHALETLNGPQALSLHCCCPLSILLHLMPRP